MDRCADQSESKRRRVEASSREERIGISFSLLQTYFEASGAAVPFRRIAGEIKVLISDFVVRELSWKYRCGEPLRLNLDPPASAERPKEVPPLATNVIADTANSTALDDGCESQSPRARENAPVHAPSALAPALDGRIRSTFSSLLVAPEDVDLIVGLAAPELLPSPQIADTPRRASVTLQPIQDKATRGEVHKAVKELLGTAFVTSTGADGRIVISRATASELRESRRRSLPMTKKPFTHFTLYKENMDSNQAFRALARVLGLSTRQFLFSGTKDKRGVTLQRVAVRGLAPARLTAVNRASFGPNCRVRVCDPEERDDGLALGDLLGNHFEVVIRLRAGMTAASGPRPAYEDTAGEWEALSQQITDGMTAVGVVNYYGPQRFGTTSILTSDIGIAIFSGQFEKAVFLIVQSKATIVPAVEAALEPLQAREYLLALACIPHFCALERDLVQHLVSNPNDFRGCFNVLPRTLSMLYMHAVQSLVWNLIASARLRIGGTSPLPGDLVLASVAAARKAGVAVDEATGVHTQAEGLEELPLGQGDAAGSDHLPGVYVLTAEDVALGVFELVDVVLTVPGVDPNLVLPTASGSSRADYDAVAVSLGVAGLMGGNSAAQGSAVEALAKQFHIHGTYRKLVVKPRNWHLRRRTLSSCRAIALPTDLDRLSMCSLERVSTPPEVVAGSGDPTSGEGADGPQNILIAEFSLPPGSYATCVLREICVLGGELGEQGSALDAGQLVNTGSASQ